ncbi:MAG: MsnO8 family LLM class oxidoreductase [Pararobbsia sp.]
MVKLSVLDQTPVIQGHTAADAVAATIDLAQLADDLGYTRYWCAEHHGLYGVANPAPEVMLARLGSVTRRIRLGSGGVMLPYYTPFKIAEQFRMLEALFPNRIDLGVGRAPGGDMKTAQAVAGGHYNYGEQFPQQVADLVGLFNGALPADHLARGVLLQPQIATQPQLWMLGSSEFGGLLAAKLGIRFAFAHFINAQYGEAVAAAYRDRFETGHESTAYLAVAIFVICADTEAEAIGARKGGRSATRADGARPQRADSLDRTRRESTIRAARSRDHRAAEGAQHHRHARAGRRTDPCDQQRFGADELIVLTVAAVMRRARAPTSYWPRHSICPGSPPSTDPA